MKAYEIIMGVVKDNYGRVIQEIREFYLDKKTALKRYKEGEYIKKYYIQKFVAKDGYTSESYTSKEWWEELKERNKDNPYYVYFEKDKVANHYKMNEIEIN